MTERIPPLAKGSAPALVLGMGSAEEISLLIRKGDFWGRVRASPRKRERTGSQVPEGAGWHGL